MSFRPQQKGKACLLRLEHVTPGWLGLVSLSAAASPVTAPPSPLLDWSLGGSESLGLLCGLGHHEQGGALDTVLFLFTVL